MKRRGAGNDTMQSQDVDGRVATIADVSDADDVAATVDKKVAESDLHKVGGGGR